MATKLKPKKRKKWQRKVDNKMRDYGDTDYDRRVIRVNKRKSKKVKSGVIDTIIHEEMHRTHPKMKERTVRRKTKRRVASIGRKVKRKLYGKYK